MFGEKSIEVTEPSAEYLKRKGLTREQYYEREHTIQKHKKELCSENSKCSMIIIPGAAHEDFGDGILLKWPWRSWKAADSYTTLDAINKQIQTFLSAADSENGY